MKKVTCERPKGCGRLVTPERFNDYDTGYGCPMCGAELAKPEKPVKRRRKRDS